MDNSYITVVGFQFDPEKDSPQESFSSRVTALGNGGTVEANVILKSNAL